jgi:hypothetical protein
MRCLAGFARKAVLAVAMLALAAVIASGCGKKAAPQKSEEERVAEEALRAAMQGDGVGFLDLVAPSFLERARAEMPDAARKPWERYSWPVSRRTSPTRMPRISCSR